MASALTINPTLTTSAPGTFNVDSTGFIQGVAIDDPSARSYLAGGVVAAPGQLPAYPAGSPVSIYGGMALTELMATGYILGQSAGPKAMGSIMMPATGTTGALPITCFSVFNQAHHMLGTVQSPVPQALPSMSVHFYRFGSRMRVPLQCDPSLISLQGGLTTQQVSWDFTAQRIIPYAAAYAANAITAASYNNTTGAATYTTTTAHGLSPGQDVTISGITPAGYNGSFTLLAGTTGSTLVAQLPPATGSTQGGQNLANATAFGTLNAGGGAVPFSAILGVYPTNCMTVAGVDAYGNATWNRNGACALVLL